MSDVTSTVGNVEQIYGDCNVAEALYQCSSKLFTAEAVSRKRVLVVLIAGTPVQDISNAVSSLKATGVRIILVRIGAPNAQLTAMVSSSSLAYVLGSAGDLTGVVPIVTSQVFKGNHKKNQKSTFMSWLTHLQSWISTPFPKPLSRDFYRVSHLFLAMPEGI